MDWAAFCDRYIPEPASVTVEAYEGSGAYGDVYAAPVAVVPCVVEDTTRTVVAQTQTAEGAEAVSSTTVYAPPGTDAPPGSRVTLPTGRVARVLSASWLNAHGHPLPEHWELAVE